ncbi:serine hydroxymethyltransferase, partial [bacterium]|nr:serine hydroxymethyltransferase [bacterium]
LILVDLSKMDVTGKDAETALDHAGITVNKNTVPNEKRSPFVTSGVRIGSPALTTRGMGTSEMKKVAGWISQVIKNHKDENVIQKVRAQVKELCQQFPIY